MEYKKGEYDERQTVHRRNKKVKKLTPHGYCIEIHNKHTPTHFKLFGTSIQFWKAGMCVYSTLKEHREAIFGKLTLLHLGNADNERDKILGV